MTRALAMQANNALGAAREMLSVFEDNGGHDGLRGEGYRATLDAIDDAQTALRALLARTQEVAGE